MITNVNYLDVMEKLSLNEWTKKMLPQALLIKRLVEKSPFLRERFADLTQKSTGRFEQTEQKIHLQEEFEKNNEKKPSLVQQSSQEELTPKPLFEIEEKRDKDFKNLLKFFIENQINLNYRSRRGLFTPKNEVKNWSSDLSKIEEDEVEVEMPKAKSLQKNAILKGGRASKEGKSLISQKCPRQKSDTQKIHDDKDKPQPLTKKVIKKLSRPDSLRRRPNQAPTGLRGRKRFGSSASRGRKILVRSRFSPSKLRKKSSAQRK